MNKDQNAPESNEMLSPMLAALRSKLTETETVNESYFERFPVRIRAKITLEAEIPTHYFECFADTFDIASKEAEQSVFGQMRKLAPPTSPNEGYFDALATHIQQRIGSETAQQTTVPVLVLRRVRQYMAASIGIAAAIAALLFFALDANNTSRSESQLFDQLSHSELINAIDIDDFDDETLAKLSGYAPQAENQHTSPKNRASNEDSLN